MRWGGRGGGKMKARRGKGGERRQKGMVGGVCVGGDLGGFRPLGGGGKERGWGFWRGWGFKERSEKVRRENKNLEIFKKFKMQKYSKNKK